MKADRDVVELAEDVSHSPLWNPDLAPTPLSKRTWSTYHIAALWIGMSVVITTYTLASGLLQQGMTWWQAMLTILLGNAIVLVPMILNAHAGTKYGVSFPVLCRASFGVRGANVPAILRALVACGWFGIQTWIGGLALDTLLRAAWPGWAGVPGNVWIAFAVFWLVQVGDHRPRARGHQEARRLVGAAAAGRRRAAARLGDRPRRRARAHPQRSTRLQTDHTPFWQLFPAALTANVGYWATLSLNIPDFTRYARSQRSQALGQALGLPATMTAFAFIGVAVTSATVVLFGEAIWDPVALIARIGSPPVIIFGALVILAGAAHDQHGRQRRLAGERLLEPGAAAHQLRDRRAHHRRHRHRDDAVEALRRCVGLHLHVAAGILEPDGRDRRRADRRLLGAAAARAVAARPVQAGREATRIRTASTGARSWALVLACCPSCLASSGPRRRQAARWPTRPSSTRSTPTPGSSRSS